MPKFLIEREIPGAGNLSGEELQAIAQKSCGALQTMGPQGGDTQTHRPSGTGGVGERLAVEADEHRVNGQTAGLGQGDVLSEGGVSVLLRGLTPPARR